MRPDILDIIHRYRQRKQTLAQTKYCADLFAQQIELALEELEKLHKAYAESIKARTN